MAERIERLESEDEAQSVRTIQVKDEGSGEQLTDSTGALKRESGVSVMTGSIGDARFNRKVDAAAAANDVVAVEMGNLEEGLTAERVRELLLQNRKIRAEGAKLVVRGVAAEQVTAIRELEGAGICVETKERMRRNVGLDVGEKLAA
ncbi:MAG TPA: hypothetical protein VJB10_00250 [Candidatus Peribacteraceae bacterium]|nr:hypothetical protein [Candidatus Peribacteraceae bacterium]